MRSNLYYNNLLNIFFIFFFCISFNNIILAKNSIEDKVNEIALELRCMTCQNQSVYESDTDFAKDIKKIIGKQIENGKSKNEIIDFMVERYGEYIVFKPMINKKNLFLWVFPFLIFLISVIFLIISLKKQKE